MTSSTKAGCLPCKAKSGSSWRCFDPLITYFSHLENSEADFFLHWVDKWLQYCWDDCRWENRKIHTKYVLIVCLACSEAWHLCEKCPVICTSLKIGFICLLSAVLNKWGSNLSDTIADEKIYHLMFEWVWSSYPVKRYSTFCEFAVQKVSGDRKPPLDLFCNLFITKAGLLNNKFILLDYR